MCRAIDQSPDKNRNTIVMNDVISELLLGAGFGFVFERAISGCNGGHIAAGCLKYRFHLVEVLICL